jgi:superoxide dismutase, Fe-Mn family
MNRGKEMDLQEQYHSFLLDVQQWTHKVKDIIRHTRKDHEQHERALSKLGKLQTKVADLLEQPDVSDEMVRKVNEEMKEIYHSFLELDTREDRERSVPIGGHTLPPLPYEYHALEPYISREIMRLHHTKHHQSYVDGLNKAEKMMQKARESNDYDLIKHWEREAAFYGSGHYLHSIFWNNMTPRGVGKPKGKLLQQIIRDFGSFDAFKRHFTEAANKAEGVGWAILVWAPRAHRLEILQTEKHQWMTQWDTIPILVLDVWEHAYYLQYKNEREKYVENWWNIANWKDVEKRFELASKVKWTPY